MNTNECMEYAQQYADANPGCADERNAARKALRKQIEDTVAAAVAAERERCAKVCDLHSRLTWNDDRKAQSRVLAAEIRRA
jgi:hypothetical protein